MTKAERRLKLIQNALQVIQREAARTTDDFTTKYLSSRGEELQASLSGVVGKAQLHSAKNLVAKLADVVEGRTRYDDASAQLYKAAVEDLRDELDAAYEGREDYW